MSCSAPSKDDDAGKTKPVDPRLSELLSEFRRSVSVPLPLSGELSVCPGGVKAQVKWTLTDVDMDKKVSFETAHFAATAGSDGGQLSFHCIQAAKEVNESISVSLASRGPRSLRAVVKEISKSGDKKSEFVEVWDFKRRLAVYDCEAAGVHGKILTKGDLPAFEWSRDESKFLFVAEKKVPKPESYFCKKPSPDGEQGTEYRWQEDWGEQIVGSVCPVIVVLELKQVGPAGDSEHEFGPPQVIEMDDTSLGQAVFTPDGTGVVTVALPVTPYRLGLIFCANREQKLFHFDLNTKQFTEIGESNKCINSPRFTNSSAGGSAGDEAYLVYLQNAVGGPHQMCAEVVRLDWPERRERKVIVPVALDPKDDEFPGLYYTKFGRHCSSADCESVFITAPWHSRMAILKIDVQSGRVANVTPDERFGSWQLLAANGDFLLAARSSPSVETHVMVGRVAKTAASSVVDWTPLDESPSSLGHDDIVWEISKLRPPTHPDHFFESIYIHPKGRQHPLIVFPHGGPHAVSPALYSPTVHFFLRAGYGVLMVNYRGSIGFGEKNLRSLPSNVGDFDIKDVQQAAEAAQAKGLATHLLLFGGSHGGFITGHLVGQHPSAYTAACLLNPVIDLSMLGPSDIPDWYWYEGGCRGDFKHDSLPSDEDLALLRARSPIAHAQKITSPCFFFLATGDLRVDKGQGLKLYKHLRGRGVESRCNMYDDNHSIASKVSHSADVDVNAITWFDRFCGKATVTADK